MRRGIAHTLCWIVAAWALAVTSRAPLAQALPEQQPERGAWVFQVDGGVSWLAESLSKTGSLHSTAARVGLGIARRIDRALYAGLSFDGVGLGASGQAIDPVTGIPYGPNYSGGWGIEQVLVFARWYPAPASPWFVQGGGGWSQFWSTRAGESSGSGAGIEVAAGYDFPIRALSCRCSLAPMISFSAGRIGNAEVPAGVRQHIDYRVPSLLVALKVDL